MQRVADKEMAEYRQAMIKQEVTPVDSPMSGPSPKKKASKYFNDAEETCAPDILPKKLCILYRNVLRDTRAPVFLVESACHCTPHMISAFPPAQGSVDKRGSRQPHCQQLEGSQGQAGLLFEEVKIVAQLGLFGFLRANPCVQYGR